MTFSLSCKLSLLALKLQKTTLHCLSVMQLLLLLGLSYILGWARCPLNNLFEKKKVMPAKRKNCLKTQYCFNHKRNIAHQISQSQIPVKKLTEVIKWRRLKKKKFRVIWMKRKKEINKIKVKVKMPELGHRIIYREINGVLQCLRYQDHWTHISKSIPCLTWLCHEVFMLFSLTSYLENWKMKLA